MYLLKRLIALSSIYVKKCNFILLTPPSRVQLSLWKSAQIAGSYRQQHVEAYIQLSILHLAILNPMWHFYFITFLFYQTPIA